MGNPLSWTAISAAASAYWANRSIRRTSRFSMNCSGWKSFTSPAKRVSIFPTSKRVTGAMPDCPAIIARQFFSVPVPRGVMSPVPVMTTRRFDMGFSSSSRPGRRRLFGEGGRAERPGGLEEFVTQARAADGAGQRQRAVHEGEHPQRLVPGLLAGAEQGAERAHELGELALQDAPVGLAFPRHLGGDARQGAAGLRAVAVLTGQVALEDDQRGGARQAAFRRPAEQPGPQGAGRGADGLGEEVFLGVEVAIEAAHGEARPPHHVHDGAGADAPLEQQRGRGREDGLVGLLLLFRLLTHEVASLPSARTTCAACVRGIMCAAPGTTVREACGVRASCPSPPPEVPSPPRTGPQESLAEPWRKTRASLMDDGGNMMDVFRQGKGAPRLMATVLPCRGKRFSVVGLSVSGRACTPERAYTTAGSGWFWPGASFPGNEGWHVARRSPRERSQGGSLVGPRNASQCSGHVRDWSSRNGIVGVGASRILGVGTCAAHVQASRRDPPGGTRGEEGGSGRGEEARGDARLVGTARGAARGGPGGGVGDSRPGAQ